MIKELTSAIALDSYSRTIDYTNNQLTICTYTFYYVAVCIFYYQAVITKLIHLRNTLSTTNLYIDKYHHNMRGDI